MLLRSLFLRGYGNITCSPKRNYTGGFGEGGGERHGVAVKELNFKLWYSNSQ